MSFDLLPDNCVVKIFSNFTTKQRFAVQSVSKRWNLLSLVGVKKAIFIIDETPWCYNRDSKFALFVSSWKQVLLALKKLPKLENVQFEMQFMDVIDEIDAVAVLISQIKKFAIVVGDVECSTEEFEEMLSRLTCFTTELEKLTMEFYTRACNSHNFVNSILENNQNLKVLRLSSCGERNDIELKTKLKEFRISRNFYIFTGFHKYLPQLEISSKTTLEVLDTFFSGDATDLNCLCISEFKNLKDLRFQTKSKVLIHLHLQNLEKIVINFTDEKAEDHSGYSFHVIVGFLERHAKLKSLKISSSNIGINDDFIEKVFANCLLPSITNFKVVESRTNLVTSKSLQFISRLPSLRSFDTEVMYNCTDEDVAAFTRNCPALTSLRLNFIFVEYRPAVYEAGHFIGGKTWSAFLEKAKLNPSKMFYFENWSYRYMTEAMLKEAPKNLRWKGFVRPLHECG